MEDLNRVIQEEKLRKKHELFVDKQKNLDALQAKKEILKQEEKEIEDVISIYANAKHKIDCMRKQKERELLEAQFARSEAAAKVAVAENRDREEKEEETMKRAIEEKDAADEAKRLARLEFDEKMKQERIADRQHYLDQQKRNKANEEELKKWEILNRYKSDKVMKEYEDRNKKEHWDKIIEYRNELLEQMEINEEEKEKEKAIEQSLANVDFSEEDKKFFAYADEVLRTAKQKGRSTYPIEKVILDYQKKNNLLPSHEATKEFCENYAKESEAIQLLKNNMKQNVAKLKNCRCKLKQKNK